MYTKRFNISNLNIDNCFGPLIDYTIKIDSERAEDYDSLGKSYALFRSISESTRFQQKMLKTQLEKVDPLIQRAILSLFTII